MRVSKLSINLLSANPTKQSNTFKQFYQQHLTNCLSVFEHFAGLVLKALIFDFFKMQILNALFFSEMLLFDKSFRQRIFRSNHPEVFLGKVFWKYAANLQENTHAEMCFQATLLKSHFGMGFLL